MYVRTACNDRIDIIGDDDRPRHNSDWWGEQRQNGNTQTEKNSDIPADKQRLIAGWADRNQNWNIISCVFHFVCITRRVVSWTDLFLSLFFCQRPDGDISIYREGRIIVQAFDQNPLDVNYVSLGTLDPNAMDYYYNCRANDDDSDALIEPKGDLIAFAGVHHSQSNSLTPTHRLLLTHVLLCLVFLWRKT